MADRHIPHKTTSNVEFLFRRIEILRDRPPIGRGSYGEVLYAMCDGLLCAAKCVHKVLVDAQRGRGDEAVRGFQQEYEWLSSMKHPNVVQYLGYHTDRNTGVPYLLMELMDESLTQYLEKLIKPVPFHKTIDFSHDIALGLDYLHYNGIMHRDLSSNNILMIAGYRAKISDFGQSTYVSAESGYRIEGQITPGTPEYMPPEALKYPPIYSSRLDNFSFGVLMIQILTRKRPEPSEATTELVGVGQVPVKEFVRRRSHLALISHRHPLYQLALYCIKDDENERPDVFEICNRLKEFKEETPEYKESQLNDPVDLPKDSQTKGLQDQIRHLQKVIERMDEEALKTSFTLEKNNTHVTELRRDIERMDRETIELKFESEKKGSRIQDLQKDIERMDRETIELKFELEKKNALIRELETGSGGRQRRGLEPPTSSPLPDPSSRSLSTTRPQSNPLLVPDLQLGNKSLKWYPCTKSIAPLYGGSATAIGNRAYVTGQSLNAIYEFNPDTNRWASLPAAPTASFALISIGGALTTVGGYDKNNYSNALYSLVQTQGRLVWQQNYPPMKDSRINPGADSNSRYVVVAGGEAQVPANRLLSNTVEILDLQANFWTIADRLPKPVKRLSLTICEDRICILGGISHQNKPLSEMYVTFLSTLVTSAAQRSMSGDLSRAFKLSNCWQTSGVPLVYGTCVTLAGYILCVGGWDNKLSNAIYLFDPSTQPGNNPWHFIGNLPKARMDAICAVLPGDRLLVVGGRGEGQEAVLSAAEIACP